MTRRTLPVLLFAGAAVFCCVLSFYRATEAAAPPVHKAPFANSVDQRFQMIDELKGIRALLKDQNTLLREQNTLLKDQKTLLIEQNALLQSGGLRAAVNSPAKG